MKPEPRPASHSTTSPGADESWTSAEFGAAENVDAAIFATRIGVESMAVQQAFGREGSALAAFAGRMVDRPGAVVPAPDPAFAHALESRLTLAFDERRVHERRVHGVGRLAWLRLPGGRFRRLTELAVVGTAAAALALGAFLVSPGSGMAPAVPTTVEAGTGTATGTATLATPEVRVTGLPLAQWANGERWTERPETVSHRSTATSHGPTERGPAALRAPVPAVRATAAPGGAHPPTSPARFIQPSSAPQANISAGRYPEVMNTRPSTLSWTSFLLVPAPAVAPLWQADLSIPLPSRAKLDAGRRRLMALAAARQAARQGRGVGAVGITVHPSA